MEHGIQPLSRLQTIHRDILMILEIHRWEIHPWMPHRDIVEWSNDRGIAIQAYCPLVRGTRWQDQTLKELAVRYGRTSAQTLLRWSLQKGYIPLPKSLTPLRIFENAALFDFEISMEDMARLETDEYVPCTWDPTVS
jgi:diketogulonate reductase-like aldo/keto reductase